MSVKSKLTQGGDGTAIPAGMVGEKRTGSSTLTPANGNWVASGALDTLPAGTWEVKLSFSQTTTRSINLAMLLSTNNGANSTGTLSVGLGWETFTPAASSSPSTSFQSHLIPAVISTAGTAMYAKGYQDGATGGGVVSCYFEAIRIA